MSEGQVIGDQRFGKVPKKATHYPQIWHVNLETLSLYCLMSEKTESFQNKNKRFDWIFFFWEFSSMKLCNGAALAVLLG